VTQLADAVDVFADASLEDILTVHYGVRPYTHKTTQYDDLRTSIEGFTDYERFYELQSAGEDFVRVLKANAGTTSSIGCGRSSFGTR
jgi:hypothetical protein